MEQFEVKYNRNRFRPPSDEVVKKLILSKEQVEGLKKRPIRCPVCNFRHHDIYEDTVGHVDIKCPKCGYEGTINLAFFRTQTKKLKYWFIPKPKTIK